MYFFYRELVKHSSNMFMSLETKFVRITLLALSLMERFVHLYGWAKNWTKLDMG